ncbi:MAG TPA: glycosyltransferase family 87 protein [Terriglobales bacterium]|nr:glycosyltransferase family 87 protein [Terriglobales bacterium]
MCPSMASDAVAAKSATRLDRLSHYGLVLALCLWSVYAWLFSTPGVLDRNGLLKGTDFLHFYVLGTLANQHRGSDLYDIAAQTELARQRVPAAGDEVYVPMYPPQVSLLFAPLARLPYGGALAVWLSLNTLLYAFCCYLIWRTCPHLQAHGWSVCILAIAYPGFFHLLLWGQSSGLALLCFSLAYVALRSRRFLLAGLAMGSLIFKPSLGVAAAFIFPLAAEWRIVAGAGAAAGAQLAAGWLHYGTPVMREYVNRVLHIREVVPLFEPRPYQMHSLSAFWQLLLPEKTLAFCLYVGSGLFVLVLSLLCWRSPAPLTLRYGILLLVTVLVAPHLTVYDMVILAPAFLLLSDWMVSGGGLSYSRVVPILLVLIYVLPLVPQAKWSHVQFSVLAMGSLVWCGYRKSCLALSSANS